MKRKKHRPEQIIAKLREGGALLDGGSTIAQVCQQLEISKQTPQRWRSQYGGMKANASPH